MMKKTIPNENAMLAFGSEFALPVFHHKKACVVYLKGPLGAGKTTFVRGFLRGVGYKGLVKSPTYTLVESYQIDDRSIFHFDFYRIAEPSELEYMGIQDYFTMDAISLIEWPEAGADFLPRPDVECIITPLEEGRSFTLTAETEYGETILRCLHHAEK
jgi:tRNA threonylcarbamoyladenosine biosynthesis protein TsaE